MAKAKKKREAQDATLINVRSLKKQLVKVEGKVDLLTERVNVLINAIESLKEVQLPVGVPHE